MKSFKVKSSTNLEAKTAQKVRASGDGKAAALFILPSFLGIAIFFLFPFIDTIKRSFFDTFGNSFVGVKNYESVINNESFILAAKNTARFICTCIPILLVVSLFLAIMMKLISPNGRKLKTAFLLPMAIPVASLVLLWKLVFADNGLINSALVSNGQETISFLNSSAAFWVLIITYVWKNAGYDMVLWSAGLDGISDSLYEAARVDGAGSIRCFLHVTLPSLMPTLGLVSIISLLNSFKVFREAYLVAGAYPDDSIYMLQHLFNNWFTNMDISRLCAAAVLLCIVLLVIILLLQKFLQSKD